MLLMTVYISIKIVGHVYFFYKYLQNINNNLRKILQNLYKNILIIIFRSLFIEYKFVVLTIFVYIFLNYYF